MPATPGNALNISATGLVKFDGTATFSGVTVTQHDVLVGAASNGITSVAPSATSGVPLISQGVAADPAFGTAVVAGGGTGIVTTTAYGVLCGGTTATGAFQNAGAGLSGQLLQSGGAAALPAYTTATYPAIATGTGTILRADGTNWVATTATYPTTTTSQQILYSTANNVVGQLTTANSAIAATNSSGTLAMRAFSVVRQVFTSTGTYTPTAGMLYCDIECVGGGGGGASINTTTASCAAGGGGGGGEYARGVFSAATIGVSKSVTIGAAGAAGTAGGSGGNGGNTSVGSTNISANGGTGGVFGNSQTNAATTSGGAGGTGGTGGDFRVAGTAGGGGFGVVLAAFPSSLGGFGGSTFFGGGAVGTSAINSAVAGSAGTGYGGGGSGAAGNNGGAAKDGGAGVKGVVIVTEYVIA